MRLFYLLALTFILSFAAFAQKSKTTTAENFTATALDGTNIELKDLRGKVVLIEFFTTRCPICVAESPKVNAMAENFAGKDVVFLALTTENADKIKEYLKKKPTVFTVIPNSFDILLKYADKDTDGRVTLPTPSYYLINQTGEIVYHSNGFDKTPRLTNEITRLLGNQSKKSKSDGK